MIKKHRTIFITSIIIFFMIAISLIMSLCNSLKAVSNEDGNVRLSLSVSENKNSQNTLMIYSEISKCNKKDSSAGQTGTGEESFTIQAVKVMLEGDNGFLGMICVEPEEFVWEGNKISLDLSQYHQYDLKKALGLDLPRNVYLEKGELILSKQLEERQPELMIKGSVNEDKERQGGIMLPQGSYTISVYIQYEDVEKQDGIMRDITAELSVSVKEDPAWACKTFEMEDGIVGKVYYQTEWKTGEYTKWYCVLENVGEAKVINYNGQGCLPLMTTKDGEEVSGFGWLADKGNPAVWNQNTVFFEEWGTRIDEPGEYKAGFWYILESDEEKYTGSCLVDVEIR